MRRVILAAALATVVHAASAEEAYLDDRSGADSLIRSFYNAVTRKEYARAWDYFGDAKPSADFDTFREGYADTDRVDVLTGGVSEEGAAGSTYYQVPVAIQAFAADGSGSIFAGCYTARLTNPQLQEPPFQGLHLEKGALKLAKGSLEEALPAGCGDGPPSDPPDVLRTRTEAMFRAAYGGICQTLEAGAEPGAADPQMHDIGFRYASEPETEPERKARLFRFQCIYGAYNSSEVYYLADDTGEITQLQFAVPELDIRYENDDYEGNVESVTIIGYRVQDQIANSDYSDDAKAIDSFSKWRGIGDASSSGRWIFRGGEFSLVRYEVDASYDGEMNPEPVLDFDSGP
jgi:hypothetical protein